MVSESRCRVWERTLVCIIDIHRQMRTCTCVRAHECVHMCACTCVKNLSMCSRNSFPSCTFSGTPACACEGRGGGVEKRERNKAGPRERGREREGKRERGGGDGGRGRWASERKMAHAREKFRQEKEGEERGEGDTIAQHGSMHALALCENNHASAGTMHPYTCARRAATRAPSLAPADGLCQWQALYAFRNFPDPIEPPSPRLRAHRG